MTHLRRLLPGTALILLLSLSPACLPAQAPPPANAAFASTHVAPSRTVTVQTGARDPAVSPDGRLIAVSILGKIYFVPIDGGRAEPVTTGTGWDTHPAWSPDGQFLAYAHHLPGTTYIAVRDLRGGTTRFLYQTDDGIGPIRFHPNGEELFFVLDRNQYDAHILRIPLTSTSPEDAEAITQTTRWHEWSFALSPEGDRIFLESGYYGGADLYMIQLPELETTRLTETPEQNEFAVAWAPDGRRVYIAQKNGVDHLMVQPVGGGEPREVSSSPYSEKTLALTPDGSAAILASGRELYRVDLSTGDREPIPFTAELTLADPPPGDLVITNARVFTGTDDEYLPDATVVVRDGRIASVQPGATEAPPPGTPVIDAGGKVLMAGLMDNHYHYWDPFAGNRLLPRGITAIRDPGASVSMSMNFKDANALGILPGPTIYSAGPLIDGPGGYHPAVDIALDEPEAAEPLVRALEAQGVDALKVYFMLEPEVLTAVVEAAHEVGLPVTGHIGVRTSWGEAMEAGIDGFSHIRIWKDFLPPELQPQGDHESLDSRKWPIARMQADWSRIDPDSPEADALIRRMVEAGVALDPTLAIQRISDEDRERFGLETFQVASDTYDKMQRFVLRAQQAGVPILAGTDNINLITELEAYQEAGIPNAEILRAATVNGAAWLGKADEFGTIQPGRRADLILVDGDPLKEIGDLRDVAAVIQDGRVVVRGRR